MRRSRRSLVPAHVHAPAQRVHHLRRIGLTTALDQSPLSSALCITHRVSLPNQQFTVSPLAFSAIRYGSLLFLGSYN